MVQKFRIFLIFSLGLLWIFEMDLQALLFVKQNQIELSYRPNSLLSIIVALHFYNVDFILTINVKYTSNFKICVSKILLIIFFHDRKDLTRVNR